MSATAAVMNAGLPIVAPHAASSMSTTGRGQLPSVSLRNSSGDSSSNVIRRLRPGGHLWITAPARDSTSLTSQNLYWRLRAACYHLVPGVARFYDTNSLPRLIEDQGLTVVECNGEPGRVTVLARALPAITRRKCPP
jgi:hypothetical protein